MSSRAGAGTTVSERGAPPPVPPAPLLPEEDTDERTVLMVVDPRLRAAGPQPAPEPALDLWEELELDDGPTAAPGTPALASPPQASPGAHPDGDTPWRQLHPASVLVNLIPQIWRTIRGAWPILLALVLGAGAGMQIFDLSLILMFFALAFGRTFVHFLTLRYRIHGGRFEVRFGLLNRQARDLDPVRIQNISLERNLFQRLAGLVEVRVETAGDAGTHGLLSALSMEAAHQLRAELQSLVREARGAQEPDAPTDPGVASADAPDAPEGPALLRAGVAELIAYGLSRRTVGTVAVLTAVGFELLSRMGPEGAEQIAWLQSQPHVLGAAFLLAFAGSWGWSAGTAVFRHWGYTLARQGDRLVSTEGLTTTRRVEIPLRKVQVVQALEPWLRRAMGYGTVLIETAALGFADGQARQAEGVIPMVEKDALPGVLGAVLPSAGVDPWAVELQPAAPRALYRAIVSRLIRYGVLASFVVAVARADSWSFLAFAAVPLALPLGWMDWRWQGWLVTPTAVVARRGFLRKRTWVVARDKLQSVQVTQTLLMRWHRLGRVDVRVAGSIISLPDIRLTDAQAVFDDLAPAGRPLDLKTFLPRAEAAPVG